MQQETLANVFGLGVVAAVARGRYLEQAETALREHFESHELADWVRTATVQRSELEQQANSIVTSGQRASRYRTALEQLGSVVDVDCLPDPVEDGQVELSNWVQRVRAEILRTQRGTVNHR